MPLMDTNLDAFITRWRAASGTERANYQLFLTELSELLGLPRPDPASDDTRDNTYVFERRVDIRNADGSSNRGFIDLYRRGSFVLEAKQTGRDLDSDGWDRAMLRAHAQADQYARALPASEGRPPFIVVVDVGRSIELYAEFTRSGSTYVPFPDPAHHRIRLDDLRDEAIRERLRLLWLDPLKLDPSREAARVTRAIADQLARLAKSLEAAGHAPQRVAHFLMRALFTMFAEDVGLLPRIDGKGAFTSLLEDLSDKPAAFAPALEALWHAMNHGGFDPRLMERIRRFNGGLFSEPDVIPLDRDQIDLLLQPHAPTGALSSPPSSAPCSNAHSTPMSATSSAPTTPPAPMSNGSSCPPSSSLCGATGKPCKSPRSPCAHKTGPTRPLKKCAASTTSSATPACSTPPAAAATSCTWRWNT